MAIQCIVVRGQKIAYFKASGALSMDEIASEGARLFTGDEWENGFSILIDYREVTETDVHGKDVMALVDQDKEHAHLFDKSRCAIVATSDLIYGLSRMWESLSGESRLTTKIFREIDEAVNWLGLKADILDTINVQA